MRSSLPSLAIARFYGPLIGALAVLGLVVGLVIAMSTGGQSTSGVLVIGRNDVVPPSQVGSTLDAVFATGAVQERASGILSLAGIPSEDLEIRIVPVSGTRAVVVQATSASSLIAQEAAAAGARSLTDSLQEMGLDGFRSFPISGPMPASDTLSPSVAAVAGLVAGIWLGLAFAITHYLLRRPVLSRPRAEALARVGRDPDEAMGRVRTPWRWLGVLRPARVTEFVASGNDAASLNGTSSGGRHALLPVGPGTPEDVIRSATSRGPVTVTWVD